MSGIPGYMRPVVIEEPPASAQVVAEQAVHHSAAMPSHVVLPVVPAAS